MSRVGIHCWDNTFLGDPPCNPTSALLIAEFNVPSSYQGEEYNKLGLIVVKDNPVNSVQDRQSIGDESRNEFVTGIRVVPRTGRFPRSLIVLT